MECIEEVGVNIICLGNGESRLGLDLDGLRKRCSIIGANAIYRDFTPDIVVAIDRGMMHEIYRSGYAKDHICYFNNWNRLPSDAYVGLTTNIFSTNINEKIASPDSDEFVMHGAEKDGLIEHGAGLPKYWITWTYLEDRVLNIPFEGLDAGPTAVKLACEEFSANNVFLIGHDLQSPSKINNVYKGSDNYLPADKPKIDADNWVFHLGQIFTENPYVNFYRVVVDNELSQDKVPEWKSIRNFKQIDMEEFEKTIDNIK